MLYEIDQLTRLFGNRTILDIDRLDFKAGHIYALIGANGAGKSSILRAVTGLQRISSGQIHFEGGRLDGFHDDPE